jgi:hypothetical protein
MLETHQAVLIFLKKQCAEGQDADALFQDNNAVDRMTVSDDGIPLLRTDRIEVSARLEGDSG